MAAPKHSERSDRSSVQEFNTSLTSGLRIEVSAHASKASDSSLHKDGPCCAMDDSGNSRNHDAAARLWKKVENLISLVLVGISSLCVWLLFRYCVFEMIL